ncbi:uncharacterized protein N7446_000814 [Penicillium canescens]|uniref:RRM domain-containing protein n=1 Tax=Penicillium canescens TaxID=5083 RepID=A0AAD6I4X4_PENCN|nr:uncharacterized protein N7446_000814 [Penicillium canescens]KAJ6030123.1 hypothetical protein N7460_010389 [Penicillium canescens]KAJ6060500.1 hypothetical protein N7444_002354 [Penicillium canescens]KAJ6077878.1 hypothetical protein N7446_000814 [Penicillium canescens]
MAPDKREKKRKAAPVAADSPAKKTKKVEAKAADATKDTVPKSISKKNAAKPKADKTAASPKAKAQPTREVKPRKRAADFLTDEEVEAPAAPAKADKEAEKKPANKKSKKEETEAAPTLKKAAAKKAAHKTKKPEPVVESEEEDEDVISAAEESEAEDDAEDDQTAALIKGFESSDDEGESGDEGYKEGQPIPKIPDSKKAQRKLAKQQKANGAPEEPGTVYIGRIPHGFYEHQMKAYFSQFGDITRLRLSRNRLTGRSKHYAFIEFSSATVAKIVADTMDNYLMYGHIVKCKFVPKEQLHPEIWKGANRRFKVTPWNRIEKKRLEKGKTRDQWTKRVESEQKKRQAKADKLKALGYEIDLPQLKSVDDVPVQEAPKAVEDAEAETAEKTVEEPAKAIEAPAPTEDTPKKSKKGKKAEEVPKAVATESPAAKSPATKTKKAKKVTKTKAKA